jgi:hypothetical protein
LIAGATVSRYSVAVTSVLEMKAAGSTDCTVVRSQNIATQIFTNLKIILQTAKGLRDVRFSQWYC